MARTRVKLTRRTDGRWQNIYKGTTYYLSADYLSKDSAWQAWLRKRVEIDAGREAEKPERRSYEQEIQTRREHADWYTSHGEHELAAEDRQYADELQKQFDSSDNPPELFTLPSSFSQSSDWIWADRLKYHRAAVQSGKSVGDFTQKFLDLHERRKKRGDLGAQQLYNLRKRLQRFEDWYGSSSLVTGINAGVVSGYHAHLDKLMADGVIGDHWTKGCWSTFKSFVKWLWGEEIIELPKNLDSRLHAVSVARKEPKPVCDEHIQILLSTASERTRLYVLLGLNLGWTQIDIAHLKHTAEIDWKKGYVQYKRHKEQDTASVPTVKYLLWDETFTLLKKFRSSHASLVLVNENGTPLLREIEKANGGYGRIDNVAVAFGRLLHKNGLRGKVEFMQLRKTSPSKIENSDWSGRGFDSLFLGHSPKTTAGQHYARRAAVPDDLMRWLAEQYGLKAERM